MAQTQHTYKDQVTVAILAGGLGSRMGGVDKGLAVYQGKRLIDHVLARIQPQATHIMINANRNLETYQSLGYAVAPDLNDAHQGPLAGMQACMNVTDTPLLLTVPCDTPYLPENLVEVMYQQMVTDQTDIVVAKTETRTHPVISLCRTMLTSSLTTYLASGNRKISLWQQQHNHSMTMFPEEQAFTNINSLE